MTAHDELQLLDNDFDSYDASFDDRTNFDMTWEDVRHDD